jgi:hypothetical protein
MASRRTTSLKSLPSILAFSGWSPDCRSAAPHPLKTIRMKKTWQESPGSGSNARSDCGAILFPEKRSPGGGTGEQIVKAMKKSVQKVEKGVEKIENEQMQMETLSVIASLGKKWAEVMTKDQAGYFVHEWQAFRYQAIKANRRRYEDEGASPFLLRSGEGETSVAEAYPCPG